MVQTCSSRGNFESSIMQENLSLSLELSLVSVLVRIARSLKFQNIFWIENFYKNLINT